MREALSNFALPHFFCAQAQKRRSALTVLIQFSAARRGFCLENAGEFDSIKVSGIL